MMYVFNLIIFISLSLCSVLLSEEKGLSLEKNITSNPVFDTKKNIFGSGSLYGPLQPIIVSARKKQESQHSVPVNVFTIQQDQLESYNIQNLVDASEIVPNVNIHHGGAGNGSFLYIRGIGSSSISAAFDQSVALNIDGAVLNRGRFIHNSYLDTKQIEILKGPQALYFGKSATAGVISLFTNDPSSEKELSITTGLEPMHKGSFIELILSGPLTQTLGTRFAFGYSKQAEVWQNYAYKNNPSADLNGTQQWFGMESLDSRLTFVWNIKENLTSKFKYSFSHFVNNGGGTAWLETICPNGSSQATGFPDTTQPLSTRQSVDDCIVNGNTSKINIDPALRTGLPNGYSNGKTGLEQNTHLINLEFDWKRDYYSINFLSSFASLDHWELDDYSFGSGIFSGLHNNVYTHFSQEIKLLTQFDSPVNFQSGLFIQSIDQEFDAYQNAFNLALVPIGPDQTLGPDPVTGFAYDYNKHHFLTTDVVSGLLAIDWRLTSKATLTLGSRYTKESKSGRIEIPYIHSAAAAYGFTANSHINGLSFRDDQFSPEATFTYNYNEQITSYLAYKEGFKSGGIDNSALPTAGLNNLTAENSDFLYYDSEKAKGIECGIKTRSKESGSRLNIVAFNYRYSNLQVQLFNSSVLQYQTFNASALTTKGLELDLAYQTPIRGLFARTSGSLTNTEYTDDFITPMGENLKGESVVGVPDLAGSFGFSYDRQLFKNWSITFSADARFTGDYSWSESLNPYIQKSFWVHDGSITIYSNDQKHSLSFVGKNLGNDYYILRGTTIPGRIPTSLSSVNDIDHAVNTNLGRTLTIKYKYTFL